MNQLTHQLLWRNSIRQNSVKALFCFFCKKSKKLEKVLDKNVKSAYN